jgi:hypothetical protein
MANPRRVNHETPILGVFAEAVVRSRLSVIGLVHDRFHVIRDDDLEYATEESFWWSRSLLCRRRCWA